MIVRDLFRRAVRHDRKDRFGVHAVKKVDDPLARQARRDRCPDSPASARPSGARSRSLRSISAVTCSRNAFTSGASSISASAASSRPMRQIWVKHGVMAIGSRPARSAEARTAASFAA